MGGIYHSFLIGSEVGEKAWDFRELLRRVVAFIHSHFVENVEQTGRFFYLDAEIRPKAEIHSVEQAHHLPDMSSFKEVITLLFLLNVVTLGHILYCPYYLEPLSITGRMYEIWAHGRQQAMGILEHVNSNYAFYMERREVPFQSIVEAFLSQQIRYLVYQVKIEEGRSTFGSSDVITSSNLIRTVAVAYSDSPWLPHSLANHRRLRRPTDSYEWYDRSEYVVSTREKGRVVDGGL